MIEINVKGLLFERMEKILITREKLKIISVVFMIMKEIHLPGVMDKRLVFDVLHCHHVSLMEW